MAALLGRLTSERDRALESPAHDDRDPRHLSRDRLHHQFPHRLVLASLATSARLAHDPIASRGPVPDHPRRPRGHGHCDGSLVAGQVVERLPAVLPMAGGPQRPARHRTPDARPARVRLGLHALHGLANIARGYPWHFFFTTGAVARPLSLSVTDIEARADHEAELPIACVEGWSASARWRGIPLHALLDEAGVDRTQPVEVEVRSLERDGLYARSVLNHLQTNDRDTMIAVAVNGERLDLDHGYPCRLIAPNRPGVMQTKWVAELVVL